MINRDEVILELINNKIEYADQHKRLGIMLNDIEVLDQVMIINQIASIYKDAKIVLHGYEEKSGISEDVEIAYRIEEAVKYRNSPEVKQHIIVFTKGDVPKKQSLEVFVQVYNRNVSEMLLLIMVERYSPNERVKDFWKALKNELSHISFKNLLDFVNSIIDNIEDNQVIINNLWKIDLLKDEKLLDKKGVNIAERIQNNFDLVRSMGFLSDLSRKNMQITLTKVKGELKKELSNTYGMVLNYVNMGQHNLIQDMNYEKVATLLSVTKSTGKKKFNSSKDNRNNNDEIIENKKKMQPISGKELQKEVGSLFLNNDEEAEKVLSDLANHLEEQFKNESSNYIGSYTTDQFEGREVKFEKNDEELTKFVGAFCNEFRWGGILKSEAPQLKDAISMIKENEIDAFNPMDKEMWIKGKSLFDVVKAIKGNTEKSLADLLDAVITNRNIMVKYIDYLLTNPYPFILFRGNKEAQTTLCNYVENYAELYRTIVKLFKEKNSDPAIRTVAEGMLWLDVIYIYTSIGEWKGMLTPLHPLHLWRYYEIVTSINNGNIVMNEVELNKMTTALSQMPHLLPYLVRANDSKTGTEIKLPQAGYMGLLPTYENHTNRYLGNDGIDFIYKVLNRWIAYAPYSQNEIKIALIDVPDIRLSLKNVSSFLQENTFVKKVNIFAYFSIENRNIVGELSKIDYNEKDAEIGKYMKAGTIVFNWEKIKDGKRIVKEIEAMPVHVAYFFDQSQFKIDNGPIMSKLYMSPLVVSYDYEYSEEYEMGIISPTANDETGIYGDYYNVVELAAVLPAETQLRLRQDLEYEATPVDNIISDGGTIWLAIADRSLNPYRVNHSLPLGETKEGQREIGLWSSDKSKIVEQYANLLKKYNLYVNNYNLSEMINKFCHIAAGGIVTLPKYGANIDDLERKQKGLLGTILAAEWYKEQYPECLIASLDTEIAKLWLSSREDKSERADLVGLRMNENTLIIEPIEVKSHQEVDDVTYEYNEETGNKIAKGKPIDQVMSMLTILKEIFEIDDKTSILISSRKEVLKYQLHTECFRSSYEPEWRKFWFTILKKLFVKNAPEINIQFHGCIIHVLLNENGDVEIENYEDQNLDLVTIRMNRINHLLGYITTSRFVEQPQDDVVKYYPEENEQNIKAAVAEGGEIYEDDDKDKNKNRDDLNDEFGTGEVKLIQDIRVFVGKDIITNEKVYWEFGNKSLENRHLLINGNSGSGKTYCIQALLYELSKQGISSVIFDYTGGFNTSKLDKKFVSAMGDKLEQRIVKVSKIPINPFRAQMMESEGIKLMENDIDVAIRISKVFTSVYKFGPQQESTIYTAVLNGLRINGDQMSFNIMAQELDNIDNANSKTVLSKIRPFIDMNPFTSDTDFSWEDIRGYNGKIYVMQLAMFERQTQILLTEIMLWSIWGFVNTSGDETKAFTVVLDEAQNLDYKQGTPAYYLLTEARKYGISCWCATQFMKPQLNEIEIQTLQQANQKLYFCPPDDGVMNVAKNIDISLNGSKEWANKLKNLKKGECVFCGSMISGVELKKNRKRIIKVASIESRN